MTLVVIWNSGNDITAMADTRISSGGKTATDAGTKLFIVPVVVRSVAPKFDKCTAQHALGMAFAGSTLLANNCHGIASALTQQLISDDASKLPSIKAIAEIYLRVGEHVTKDLNSRRIKQSDWTFFESALFGYCPELKKLCVYVMRPDIDGLNFAMRLEQNVMAPKQVIALGSGRELFHRFLVDDAAEGRGSAQAIFNKVVASRKLADVGGYTQYMIADERGARLVPTIIQSPDNPDNKTLSVLGFDVWSLENIEGFSFGQEAISAGDEAATGRRALRAKGVDPDGDVPLELQNLASMEAALRFAFQSAEFNGDAKLNLDATLDLSFWPQRKGQRYFVAACLACRHFTPLCEDPSTGGWNPLVGIGYLQAKCVWCDQLVSAGPREIASKVWGSSKMEHAIPLPGLPGG